MTDAERQNGWQSQAQANMFIPSTLTGPNVSAEGGSVDLAKVKHNMEAATNVHISRVQDAPCGAERGTIGKCAGAGAKLQLFKGAAGPKATKMTSRRQLLLSHLSASKKKREDLRKQHPQEVASMQKILDVQAAHQIKSFAGQTLPIKHCFLLVCCYKTACMHELCIYS